MSDDVTANIAISIAAQLSEWTGRSVTSILRDAARSGEDRVQEVDTAFGEIRFIVNRHLHPGAMIVTVPPTYLKHMKECST